MRYFHFQITASFQARGNVLIFWYFKNLLWPSQCSRPSMNIFPWMQLGQTLKPSLFYSKLAASDLIGWQGRADGSDMQPSDWLTDLSDYRRRAATKPFSTPADAFITGFVKTRRRAKTESAVRERRRCVLTDGPDEWRRTPAWLSPIINPSIFIPGEQTGATMGLIPPAPSDK